MAELRKIDYNKVVVLCNEEGKDYIPSNWHIPARKAWQIVAWCMIQIHNGATIRDNKTVDHLIHKFWEYVEEHAVAVGKEYDDEEEKS